MARVCPHCRNVALADLRVDAPVDDPRLRYQVGRALSATGPGAPGISAAQATLAARGGLLLRRALPGLAASCAAVLAERGVAFALEPAASPAGAPRAGPTRAGAGRLVAAALVVVMAVAAGLTLRKRRVADVPRLTAAQVAQRALPSTVSIRCAGSMGSGFFAAPGQVLTNAHVVCPAGETMAFRLPDGSEGTGRVLQSDERLDLALIEVSGIAAAPLPLGDAGDLRVGDRLVVVGSPKGMEFSVSQGGVSSLDRVFLGVAMIQTDAPINPGNSGGPMLDETGRVVGVISLKRLDAEGIGLALPINYAFSGPEAMLASPLQGESDGFRRMAAHADAQDGNEANTLKATGQRPGLVGVAAPGNGTILAEVWWPAASSPGEQAFEFELDGGDESACTLHGGAVQWQKAEGRNGGSILKPRVKDWLERHGFASDIWVTLVVLSLSECSDQAIGPGSELRMHGADDGATAVRF